MKGVRVRDTEGNKVLREERLEKGEGRGRERELGEARESREEGVWCGEALVTK